jgi:hypothetical protein
MTSTKTQSDRAVQVSIETIKPDTARDWLLQNTNNRRVRARVVDAYARDMVAGNWRMSGEAIKFGAAGTLLDGQHRLHAIVEADVAVQMLVVRGVDEAAQTVMDTGAARTAGDALKLLGEGTHYSALAAAARLAILYNLGEVVGNNIKITNTEIVEFAGANPDLRRAVELAGSWHGQIDVPLSILSMTTWRLIQVDADDCILFFSRVADKTNLSSRDPILALINRLAEIRRSGRRVERGDYLSLIFRAWNYWRSGKTVAALPVRVNGGAVDIPEPK